jgi:hypothetical protein
MPPATPAMSRCLRERYSRREVMVDFLRAEYLGPGHSVRAVHKPTWLFVRSCTIDHDRQGAPDADVRTRGGLIGGRTPTGTSHIRPKIPAKRYVTIDG